MTSDRRTDRRTDTKPFHRPTLWPKGHIRGSMITWNSLWCMESIFKRQYFALLWNQNPFLLPKIHFQFRIKSNSAVSYLVVKLCINSIFWLLPWLTDDEISLYIDYKMWEESSAGKHLESNTSTTDTVWYNL